MLELGYRLLGEMGLRTDSAESISGAGAQSDRAWL